MASNIDVKRWRNNKKTTKRGKFLNIPKRDKNVNFLSMQINVTFFMLFVLPTVYYNFIMLHCPSILNSVANDAKYN